MSSPESSPLHGVPPSLAARDPSAWAVCHSTVAVIAEKRPWQRQRLPRAWTTGSSLRWSDVADAPRKGVDFRACVGHVYALRGRGSQRQR
jgi:hypothetical protein